MGGGDTKSVQTQQSSQTDPWAPTQPALMDLISKIGGINPSVTGDQSTALASLSKAASGIPNFGTAAGGAVNNAFGTSTAPQQGMLGDAYQNYIKQLNPDASGANLDPYKTPGFSDALGTLTNDITNQVKGVYAGSGRDPSGAGSFAGSLGRGLMQGEAPVITSQFNQNKQNQLNAAGSQFGAAGTTAGGLTSQQMAQLAAQFQGIQGASTIPGLLTQPGQTQLGVANQVQGQPAQNLSQLEQLLTPIAALGGQTQGSGTQNTESSKSLLSNIMGSITGGIGALGTTGAFGSAGWLTPLLLASDERVKEDIEPIGKTSDGQNLYSYRYIGDDETRVGLLAQEVEKRDPGAVHEIGGIKTVDYRRALAPSREIGMLKMAA